MAVSAIQHRDLRLAISLVLVPVAAAALFLTLWAGNRSDVIAPSWAVIAGLLAAALLPLGFFVHGAGLFGQQRWVGGIASMVLGALTLTLAAPFLSYGWGFPSG